MSSFAPLSIITWNVRGLNSKDKRDLILLNVQKTKAQVILLQEIKAQAIYTSKPERFLGPMFQSTFTAYISHQCAIIVRKGTFANIEVQHSSERIIHLEATTHSPIPTEAGVPTNRQIDIFNIYAPAQPEDRVKFFGGSELWGRIADTPGPFGHPNGLAAPLPTPFVIIGGDFNDFPSVLDILPFRPTMPPNRFWPTLIEPMLVQKGLVDPLRESVQWTPDFHSAMEELLHNEEHERRMYTRLGNIRGQAVVSRIDHIILSRSFGRLFTAGEDSYFASRALETQDHSQVTLRLALKATDQAEIIPAPKEKRFSIHHSWCDDPRFVEQMKARARATIPLLPSSGTSWERWKHLKTSLQEEAVSCMKKLPRPAMCSQEIQKEHNQVQTEVDTMIKLGMIDSSCFRLKLEEKKKIETRLFSSLEVALKQRENIIEETPQGWLPKTDAFHRQPQSMTGFLDVNGSLKTQWTDMEHIVRLFYGQLYDTPVVNYETLNAVLHEGGRSKKLSSWQCKLLREPITAEQIGLAIAKMNKHSVSGEDGWTLPVYEMMPEIWKELADFATSLVTYKCKPEPNTPRLLVSLLHKAKETYLLKNWRPISLINIDQRIVSTVVNTNFNTSRAIHQILPASQTSFVSGRQMADSILTMRLFLAANELGMTTKTQAIIFLDQEKAYDRLAPAATYRALDWYGVPRNIIQYLKNSAAMARAQYRINGAFTEAIEIRCGILQGDPFAPSVFCMGTQPYVDVMKARKIIFRYNTPATNGPDITASATMWPQYADDWSPVICKKTLPRLLLTIKQMKEASNILVNKEKTIAVLLTPTTPTGRNETQELRQAIPFPQKEDNEEFRYLGAFMRADGQQATESHFELIAKARKGMYAWQALSQSWLGRVRLINCFFTSKVWHGIGAAGPLDYQSLNLELKQQISHIIFGGDRTFVNLQYLAQPLHFGGLGLIYPEHMFIAMAGRDLASGLNDNEHFGPLFRACLTKVSLRIGQGAGTWISRRTKGWIEGRHKTFPPLWIRYAHAAEQLNLSIDPASLSGTQILELPFRLPDIDYSCISSDDLYFIRRGGIHTWNDFLACDPTISQIKRRANPYLLLMTSASRQRIYEQNRFQVHPSAIGGRFTAASALNFITKYWLTLYNNMPENWQNAFCQINASDRVQPSRWAIHPDRWPNISLPGNGLTLAGHPIAEYTIKKGRQFIVKKSEKKHMLPSRFQVVIWNQRQNSTDTVAFVRQDLVNTEYRLETSENTEMTEEEEQTLQNRGFYQARPPAPLSPEWLSQSTEQSLTDEAKQFWTQLAMTKRSFKMSPKVYSTIYSMYRGSFPKVLTNGKTTTCCKDEHSDRRHQLYTCLRTSLVWEHLKRSAVSLGLEEPTFDERECCELFPNWRGSLRGEQDSNGLTIIRKEHSETLLKMLLIAVHLHHLFRLMNQPAQGQVHEDCIVSIKQTMADYDALLPAVGVYISGDAYLHAHHR